MNRGIPYRISAIIMAILFLFSSVGLTIDLHYCQDEVKSFSLIGEARPCHDTKRTCTKHRTSQSSKKHQHNDCCKNKKLVIEPIDISAVSSVNVGQHIFQLDQVSLPALVSGQAKSNYAFAYRDDFILYKPPIPDQDRRILLQSFII